jgi:preprotein translocase subunit SecA
MRQQRETMYKQRNYILDNDCIHPMIQEEFHKLINDIVSRNAYFESSASNLDVDNIMKQLGTVGIGNNIPLDPEKIAAMNEQDATEYIFDLVWKHYDEAVQPLTDYKKKIEKVIALKTIDLAWREHIDTMDKFRSGVGLRSYAQSNPIQAYVKEGFEMFEEMMSNIATDIARTYIAAVNEGERIYKEQHPDR